MRNAATFFIENTVIPAEKKRKYRRNKHNIRNPHILAKINVCD